MSKIKNDGLDQYGAEPFEQQQFGTAGVEGVKAPTMIDNYCHLETLSSNEDAQSENNRQTETHVKQHLVRQY